MRLSISHTTIYHYARQVTIQPHRMMLRPRGSHDLQVLNHTLHCSPVAQLVWSQDVFGNLVATATFSEPAVDLRISSRLSLNVSADAWPVFRIAPHAHNYPFGYTDDEIVDLGRLREPQHADAGVEAWARSFVASDPTDTLSLLKDLNAGILSAAEYRPRDEEGTQSAAETLRLASASCRDLAALFIDAARYLGFGARAASGYLFDAEAGDALEDTTHAWAEVYLPDAGWIAFDPTHRRVGAAGLIPVAVGRANAQIMPIVGSYAGAAADYLGMEVDVRVAQEPGY